MNNTKRKAIEGTVGIAIASGVIMLLMTVFGTFQKAFCEMHGYSATEFSVAIAILSGGGILAGLFIGKLVSSVGIKKLIILASFAPVLAMAGLRYCGNLLAVYLIALVAGVLVGLATPAVMNMYIGSWFAKGNGTMVSAAKAISSLWKFLLIPVATTMLVKLGDRSMVLFGLLMSGIALAGALLMKGMPSDYGVEPVNLVEKENNRRSAVTEEVYNVQMPAAKLLGRFPAFAALVMVFISIVAVVMLSTYGVHIYASYIGDMVTASWYMSLASVMGMVFPLVFGVMSDKIGVRKSILIFGLLFFASCIFGPVIGGKLGVFIMSFFSGMAGFTTMYIGIGFPLIVGYKNMAAFAGWSGALMSVGGMIAPMLAMVLVDLNGGSYDLVVYVSGVIILVCAIISIVCISPKCRASIKAADEQWIAKNTAK